MTKLKITFKDPDGVYECVRDELRDALPPGLPDDEAEVLLEHRTQAADKALRRWIEGGEYLTVEFDLEAGTATVQEPSR